MNNQAAAVWFARLAVGLVFAVNVACAVVFIFQPQAYAAGFELSGITGIVIVQSFGILFLMWNATYPPVILQPRTHRTLYGVILVQQVIGVVGETWLWLNVSAEHATLRATGLRFMVFDGLGLLLMVAAYLWLVCRLTTKTQRHEEGNHE